MRSVGESTNTARATVAAAAASTARETGGTATGTVLPDGYSQIFRIVCFWHFGLLDSGSATLCCKI